MTESASLNRCGWADGSDLMRHYHDEEWGVPVRDDRKLFEYLILDAFQAGLSWSTILRKREGFRIAFRNFEPEAVARMTESDMESLMSMADIVRNRSKIQAAVTNAQAFLTVAGEHGGFAPYLWSFVGDKTIRNSWESDRDIPAQTDESRALSADLKRRGFRFVGPTIVYAVMQSAGLVDDHVIGCFRRGLTAA